MVGGYVRSFMNSIREEREEKRWRLHKKVRVEPLQRGLDGQG